ncbi:MAG: ribonuclease HI family protein [Thermoanaerobaculaceae bacterium]|jgi:ribonuclease HI
MSPSLKAAAAVDGGSRGNPGEAGCGIVLELRGRTEGHTLYLGTATNNVAEYAALLAALERAQVLGVDSLEVKSDSQLLVEQMNGRYKVKAAHLRLLWLRARMLAAGFRRFGIAHVPRDANRAADELANRAMNERISTLPRPDGLP